MDAIYTEAVETANEIKISQRALAMLTEIGKWSRFLAIMGYIGVGFILLASLFMIGMGGMMDDNLIGTLGNGLAGVLYLGMAALYYFPVHYLYKFSAHLKTALAVKDAYALESGFEYLKKHYRFIGIMTIVVLSLYLLIFLFAIMAGLAVALFQ